MKEHEGFCGVCNTYYKAEKRYGAVCPKCKREDDYNAGYYLFHKFVKEYPCDDDLNYNSGYYKQLHNMKKYEYCFGDKHKVKMSIIGAHMSKSIDLPVVQIEFCGLKIIYRDNFHGIEMYIKSPISLERKWIGDLITTEKTDFYYEGMPYELEKIEWYDKNNQEFYCRAGRLETLFFILGKLVSGKWK